MVDVDKEALYTPSRNIVARIIEGELIIVPLVSGIGDMNEELFSVNETGRKIWDKLDGKTSFAQIINAIAADYAISPQEIEDDVRGFLIELLKRKMIFDAGSSRTDSKET